MLKDIEYENLEGDYILIDVRSEGEYSEYTIPGAINIPIFNDEERKEIGTVYVRESVDKAKSMGVEAASKKLPYIYEKICDLQKKYKKVVLFCARGGLRSTVLSTFLDSLGVKVYKLKGGYKGYRAYINRELPVLNEKVQYVILQGNTGMGKTEILKELKRRGHNIVDLEGCANHRGSLLGSVGIGKCNSQKAFESLVYEQLKERNSDLVFLEGESKRIGNIIIPDYIYNKMRESKRILVKGDLDYRAKNIIDEYTKGENWKEEIINSLNNLRKYISEENIARYLNMVENGQILDLTKELMVKYYDPMYKNGENKYKYELVAEINSIKTACDIIEKWVEGI
ncbi:tRNA 2-selenouridine(34) synthase MnmH [Haloimpatiens lingqiaonensis]|uniref:tRNA 2-selenouridine(34) synthase MnmH n=1 Tax=Haloimpatiens lingqiaonensis TaxID=1380675 RepID=UPI0010FE10B7|nr:tRNA 2-selenouridine(34) synthase MnmH [Haloimpatiens lingqiaonensis]